MTDVDVFCSSIERWIIRQLLCPKIVAENGDIGEVIEPELDKKISKIDHLFGALRKRHILRLGGRYCDSSLFHRFPRIDNPM